MEPALWLKAKGAFLILLGFTFASECLQALMRFGFGIFVGFWEGTHGALSDSFLIELIGWTAPFFATLSLLGGAWAGMWIFFKRTKGQSLFQWLLKLIWQPGQGSLFIWPVVIGISLGLSFYFLSSYWFFPAPDFMLMVCVAPFIEECLFRGILYTGFSQSWGPFWGGMMVTSLFVAIHFPKIYVYPLAAFALLCLGLATLWLRLRTQALASGMVCHMTYNAFCVVGMFLFHSSL